VLLGVQVCPLRGLMQARINKREKKETIYSSKGLMVNNSGS